MVQVSVGTCSPSTFLDVVACDRTLSRSGDAGGGSDKRMNSALNTGPWPPEDPRGWRKDCFSGQIGFLLSHRRTNAFCPKSRCYRSHTKAHPAMAGGRLLTVTWAWRGGSLAFVTARKPFGACIPHWTVLVLNIYRQLLGKNPKKGAPGRRPLSRRLLPSYCSEAEGESSFSSS